MLLIVSIAEGGDSRASTELEIDRMDIDAKTITTAERVRARFNLSVGHRSRIEDWLTTAKLGDTLLVCVKEYRIRGIKDDFATDDVALIIVPDTPQPKVSRLVFKEVTTVEAALQSLPVNAKRVTRASKTSKK